MKDFIFYYVPLEFFVNIHHLYIAEIKKVLQLLAISKKNEIK